MLDNSIKETQEEQFLEKGDCEKIGEVPVDSHRIERAVFCLTYSASKIQCYLPFLQNPKSPVY